MLTLPTTFNRLRLNRQRSGACFILELTIDGSGTKIYFAEKALYLPDDTIEVFGFIVDFPIIHRSFDWNTSRYEVGNVELSITNLLVRKESGSERWDRVSDLIGGAQGRTATVYWYPGGYASQLSDCLTLLIGTTTDIPEGAGDTIKIQIDERDNIGHRPLPQTLMTDASYPQMPAERKGITAPLAYGAFDEGNYHRKSGIMLGEHIGAPDGQPGGFKWLIADHVVGALGPAWWKIDALNAWAESFAGVTFNENDSGVATMEIDNPADVDFYIHLFPTAGDSKAFDRDEDSYASIVADSTTTGELIFTFHQNGSTVDDITENGIAAFMQSGGNADVEIHYKIERDSGITFTSCQWSIEYGNTSTWVGPANMTVDSGWGNGTFRTLGISATYDWTDATTGVFFHPGIGATGSNNNPMRLRIRINGSGFTAGVTEIGRILEIRFAIKCSMTPVPPTVFPKAIRRGGRGGNPLVNWPTPDGWLYGYPFPVQGRQIHDAPPLIGAEGEGREFGSWIDNVGRTNGLNAGESILWSPYVIESILRDELGAADADIDEASFDTVYDNSESVPLSKFLRQMFINLTAGTSVDSQQIIEQICREHLMILFRRQTGEMKLIETVAGSRETVSEPIRLTDLNDAPQIWLTSTDDIFNNVVARYASIPGEVEFVRRKAYADSGSDTRFGTRSSEVTFDTIWDEDMVDAIMDVLLSTTAVLSDRHVFARFDTRGLKFAGVELGDELNVDADAFSAAKKLYGRAWDDATLGGGSDIPFIVYRIQTSQTGVVFDCHNLNYVYDEP